MWLFLIYKKTCLLNVSACSVLLLTLYRTMQLLLLGFLLRIHFKNSFLLSLILPVTGFCCALLLPLSISLSS